MIKKMYDKKILIVPERILVVQLRRIGDVLLTTPSIRALSEAFPKSQISLLTEHPSVELFKYNPRLAQVIAAPSTYSARAVWQLVKQLQAQQYQLVIDFYGSPCSALLTWLSHSPHRIGFDFRHRRIAYTNRVPVRHEHQYSAIHKAELLKPLGLKVPSPQLELYLPPDHQAQARRRLETLGLNPEQPLVIFSPVSRKANKRWSADRFAHLANYLVKHLANEVISYAKHAQKAAYQHQSYQSQHKTKCQTQHKSQHKSQCQTQHKSQHKTKCQIVIAYGPQEQKYAQQMSRQMEVPHTLLPPQSLLDFAVILAQATLFIGNDNGNRHIAIALNIPTLATFSWQQAHHWSPPDSHQHQTVEARELAKLPTSAMITAMQKWLKLISA